MKKLILSALLIGTATFAANAQANSILLYGNAGYHSTKDYNGDKTRSYNFSPGIGYQFDNHWTAGVYGSFGSDRTLTTSILPSNENWQFNNSYGAGAFLRYTVGLGKIFAVFNQLNLGYAGATYGTTGGSASTSVNGFQGSFTPNIGINVHKGFALNFNFGGLDYTHLGGHGLSSQTFNVTFGTQVNVGISKNIFCGNRHHGVKKNHGEVEEIIIKEEE